MSSMRNKREISSMGSKREIFIKGRSRAEAALQYKQKDEEKGPHHSMKHFTDK